MGSLNPKAYSAVLKTRQAYRFDIGALFMRLFAYTTTIGTITTLTLSGASALMSTSVASLIAVCMIFVAPRVSKRIDERGQSAVVPGATAIAAAGIALMLATTFFGWPFWLNYVAAPLISFLPNAQALVRTRWSFLIQTGRLGDDAPALKTAYAYEGVLEDIAFMVGPALVVALAAGITPIAGMGAGIVIYCVGAALLVSSKDTEPEPGWGTAPAPDKKGASVLRTSPVVRVLFAIMILYGCVYGSFDAAAISYCDSIDFAILASAVFAIESVFSVIMSVLFGMLGIAAPLRKQFVLFNILFGALYSLMALISSPESLLVIACIAALSYAPMYITLNVTCERAVPSANLTEALSWISSGTSVGMVIGPVAGGVVIDTWGPLAGFDLTTCFAAGIIVVVVCCIPVLRKHLR